MIAVMHHHIQTPAALAGFTTGETKRQKVHNSENFFKYLLNVPKMYEKVCKEIIPKENARVHSLLVLGVSWIFLIFSGISYNN